jgi:hypothetical protein
MSSLPAIFYPQQKQTYAEDIQRSMTARGMDPRDYGFSGRLSTVPGASGQQAPQQQTQAPRSMDMSMYSPGRAQSTPPSSQGTPYNTPQNPFANMQPGVYSPGGFSPAANPLQAQANAMNQRAAFVQQANQAMLPFQYAQSTGQNFGAPQFDLPGMRQQAQQMVQDGWYNPFQRYFAQQDQAAAPPQNALQDLFARNNIQAPPGFMDQLLGVLGQQAPQSQLGGPPPDRNGVSWDQVVQSERDRNAVNAGMKLKLPEGMQEQFGGGPRPAVIDSTPYRNTQTGEFFVGGYHVRPKAGSPWVEATQDEFNSYMDKNPGANVWGSVEQAPPAPQTPGGEWRRGTTLPLQPNSESQDFRASPWLWNKQLPETPWRPTQPTAPPVAPRTGGPFPLEPVSPPRPQRPLPPAPPVADDPGYREWRQGWHTDMRHRTKEELAARERGFYDQYIRERGGPLPPAPPVADDPGYREWRQGWHTDMRHRTKEELAARERGFYDQYIRERGGPYPPEPVSPPRPPSTPPQSPGQAQPIQPPSQGTLYTPPAGTPKPTPLPPPPEPAEKKRQSEQSDRARQREAAAAASRKSNAIAWAAQNPNNWYMNPYLQNDPQVQAARRQAGGRVNKSGKGGGGSSNKKFTNVNGKYKWT